MKWTKKNPRCFQWMSHLLFFSSSALLISTENNEKHEEICSEGGGRKEEKGNPRLPTDCRRWFGRPTPPTSSVACLEFLVELSAWPHLLFSFSGFCSPFSFLSSLLCCCCFFLLLFGFLLVVLLLLLVLLLLVSDRGEKFRLRVVVLEGTSHGHLTPRGRFEALRHPSAWYVNSYRNENAEMERSDRSVSWKNKKK